LKKRGRTPEKNAFMREDTGKEEKERESLSVGFGIPEQRAARWKKGHLETCQLQTFKEGEDVKHKEKNSNLLASKYSQEQGKPGAVAQEEIGRGGGKDEQTALTHNKTVGGKPKSV